MAVDARRHVEGLAIGANLTVAIDALDRVERSISHLLRAAREEAPAPEDTWLEVVVDGALDRLAQRLREVAAKVERTHEGNIVRINLISTAVH